jgi:type VI secretion system secreted protein VgrG
MPAFTQENRPIRISTVLGTDVLLLQGFSGQEGVSTPYSYTLDLWSEDASIDPTQLLNTAACITLQVPGGERPIHGRINRFTQLERQGELVGYRAELVPWFWFLSLSSDCKIFQNLSVLEIVEQVFQAQGFSDFDIQCRRSYPTREYCVQYRETHLNFVSRLLEEEGIFYFFKHEDDKHTLMLVDDSTPVDPCPAQSVARMNPKPGAFQEEDVVNNLQLEHGVHIGKVTLRDYSYADPSLQLETTVSGNGIGEVYDYPGSYTDTAGDGNAPQQLERYARLLLEEREAWHHLARGSGSCRAFQSGYSFDLEEHYRSSANQSYRLLYVQHTARTQDYQSAEGSGSFDYQNSFVAIARSVPFRPPRTAPKPVVQGSQTAVVVGKSGEEIWVDNLGRVKIQFYWDRDGQHDENSSCAVRFSTSWAGKTWGMIQIPRIGQEVIVDFLEGDPDKPIITGRVYNADQTPPYALPDNQTQSGVKSRSSKNGTGDNFNELRFEDLKGSEQIFIHAEKDMVVEVENDRTKSVDHNESVTIGNDRTESVANNESITIEKNRTESVGADESVSVDGNRSLTVAKDETIDITGKRTDSVGKAEDVTVGDNRTHNVGKDDKLDVGKNFALTAGDSITLKTGDASIAMKKNGDITIKGNNIKIEASGKITIKASQDVNIKGSKVTNN